MKKQEIWRELAQRELARRSFAEYLAYVQGRMWKRTRMAEFLAGRVQTFLDKLIPLYDYWNRLRPYA